MPSRALHKLLIALTLMFSPPAPADGTGPALASYYDRHIALVAGVAYAWSGSGTPRVLRDGVRQVGAGASAWYLLLADGSLVRWSEPGETPLVLMGGLQRFAAGESGWFGIDAAGRLWFAAAQGTPQVIAQDVIDACIGDSADYYITRDGALWVRGLAHRGQYGDGKLQSSPVFVSTARDALAVRAHTGHALYLRRDGTVLGTGGNRFGPLSTHGLGDKADRWGPVFEGAVALATGSRHTLAIRADASLWVWGGSFGFQPRQLMADVRAAAAGDSATLAIDGAGRLWQWDGASGPRRVVLPAR